MTSPASVASVLQTLYGSGGPTGGSSNSTISGKEQAPLILDCRCRRQYHVRRLAGSACIPLELLNSQCFLLPDKDTPFIVVVPALASDAFPQHLKGFPSLPNFLRSRGWGLEAVLHDSHELWEAAQQLGVLDQGAESQLEQLALRQRWLFSPAPLLKQAIGQVEAALSCGGHSGCSGRGCSNGSPATWRALDVGCGSGRDAVWLACRQPECQPASCGGGSGGGDPAPDTPPARWQVTGVDEWLGALQRAEELGVSVGLDSSQLQLLLARVNPESGEFEQLVRPGSSVSGAEGMAAPAGGGAGAAPASLLVGTGSEPSPPLASSTSDLGAGTPALPPPHHHQQQQLPWPQTHPPQLLPGSFQLITCIRFLERALLPHLPSMLAPGGWLLYCTWLDGPGLRAFGRPSGRERVLQPGELAGSYFGAGQGFRVVRDEVALAPDGRELSMFVAQKL